MKISLIGPMACGKTTIGRSLAARLNIPFYDTDHLIELKAAHTVSEIFALMGETKFRMLETEVLKDLLANPDDMIIATGGGIIKDAENRALLHQHSRVLFLDISVAEQLKRTEGDTMRPLLMVGDKEKVLTALRLERQHWYQEIAHCSIQVDHLSPAAIVELVLCS